jgi:hypothetical protein
MSTSQQPTPAPSTPADEDQQEQRIDEAEDESFPASDANSETQPHPIKR